MAKLLTLGDLAKSPDLQPYRRGQIAYAIQEYRIEPRQRAGIIRLFSEDQIAEIQAALRRTTKSTTSEGNLK